MSSKSFIAYDAKHVSKQERFEDFKDKNLVFRKVYETEAPSITLYNPAGYAWETDPGDFSKVQIKLENGNMVEFDNLDGWIKLKAPIKLPEQSPSVKKTPYFLSSTFSF